MIYKCHVTTIFISHFKRIPWLNEVMELYPVTIKIFDPLMNANVWFQLYFGFRKKIFYYSYVFKFHTLLLWNCPLFNWRIEKIIQSFLFEKKNLLNLNFCKHKSSKSLAEVFGRTFGFLRLRSSTIVGSHRTKWNYWKHCLELRWTQMETFNIKW